MSVTSGASYRAQRKAEIDYKYSYRGRLERFCQGRIRILPIRLAYEETGSLLLGLFGDWQVLGCLHSCPAFWARRWKA